MPNYKREEVAKLLGLDPSVDDATLSRAIDAAVARQAAARAAERERKFEADDKRLVNAAVADGRIAAASKGKWLGYLRADREGTKRVIASLAPGLPPEQSSAAGAADGVDADAQRAYDGVMASLAGLGFKPESKPVQAARPVGQNVGSLRDAPTRPDGMVCVRGRPPEQWTAQEQEDAMLWRLGGRFRAGLRPPPEAIYYTPNPGGKSTDYVDHGDGTGHWELPDQLPEV